MFQSHSWVIASSTNFWILTWSGTLQFNVKCSVDSEHSSCPSSHESVSVSASLAPRVGGWLAYNGFSVPACLLTESSLYSVFTQRIPEPYWQDTIPPPRSEASVGKRTRIVSDHKLGGTLTIVKIPESPTWWFNRGKNTVLLWFTSFCRNARGLIVWENNLGKRKRVLMLCMWSVRLSG